MSYTINKGEIIIEGWEKGIASSPHRGIANIQAGNISTETGEVMVNYNRLKKIDSVTTGGNVTPNNATSLTFTITAGQTLVAGSWVSVTNSSITGLSNATYYVSSVINSGGNFIVSLVTPGNTGKSYVGTAVTGLGATGTAFFTVINQITQPVARATENYFDTNHNPQTRYFIMDVDGKVFVYDTAKADPSINFGWFLPCAVGISVLSAGMITKASGLAVLNGWLAIIGGSNIYWRSTSLLGSTPSPVYSAALMSPSYSNNPHAAFVGHNSKMYYCDGNYLGSVFPDTSLVSAQVNIQSYAQYTAAGTTGTVTTIISGSAPSLGAGSTARIPAMFFAGEDGTQPTNLVVGTIYWIEYAADGSGHFTVHDVQTAGSTITLDTGAAGSQFFNTFNPVQTNGYNMITFTPQRLTLPSNEIAQSIGEISTNIIVGCQENVLYQWNQINPTPQDIIPLPETNSVKMITVNNMLYVFAGSKGNVYVTNGSTASLVLSVPDYCAGIAGSPSTYYDPYFTWGDAMYLRGRVWFSILDQTTIKTGNCGGVWSFVPSQNFFYGQDTGLSLRLENRNSYESYNGYCPVLLPIKVQTAVYPQYWSAWVSNIVANTLYGIDGTGTTVGTLCIVETDLVPTGTMLDKKTFSQIEYKLSAPLVSSESVVVSFRQNSTAAWVSCGVVNSETSTDLAGYLPVVFEKGQWLQLKLELSSSVSVTSASFVRLKQIIIR